MIPINPTRQITTESLLISCNACVRDALVYYFNNEKYYSYTHREIKSMHNLEIVKFCCYYVFPPIWSADKNKTLNREQLNEVIEWVHKYVLQFIIGSHYTYLPDNISNQLLKNDNFKKYLCVMIHDVELILIGLKILYCYKNDRLIDYMTDLYECVTLYFFKPNELLHYRNTIASSLTSCGDIKINKNDIYYKYMRADYEKFEKAYYLATQSYLTPRLINIFRYDIDREITLREMHNMGSELERKFGLLKGVTYLDCEIIPVEKLMRIAMVYEITQQTSAKSCDTAVYGTYGNSIQCKINTNIPISEQQNQLLYAWDEYDNDNVVYTYYYPECMSAFKFSSITVLPLSPSSSSSSSSSSSPPSYDNVEQIHKSIASSSSSGSKKFNNSVFIYGYSSETPNRIYILELYERLYQHIPINRSTYSGLLNVLYRVSNELYVDNRKNIDWFDRLKYLALLDPFDIIIENNNLEISDIISDIEHKLQIPKSIKVKEKEKEEEEKEDKELFSTEISSVDTYEYNTRLNINITHDTLCYISMQKVINNNKK